MKIDLVIKFGGSSITDKETFETLRPDALHTACRLIKSCVEKGISCVVVHGAGSFGHHQAKQYKVNSGWLHIDDTDTGAIDTVKRGLCLTRQSVTKLHHHVISALLDESIPAIGISSLGIWESDNRTVIKHDLHPVTSLLDAGFVPVLHGDAMLDRSLGCVVLSGDTIIETICAECSVDRVVFLTSVDGVYDKPPLDYPDAKLQQEILINKEGGIITEKESSNPQGIVSDTSSGGHDVTGGMTLKLSTAINIVKNSEGQTPVYVCKVGSQYSMEVCCRGQVEDRNAVGTAVRYMDT